MDCGSGTAQGRGEVMRRGIWVLLLMLTVHQAPAVERLGAMPHASIKGVEVTPKVAFIIPWQRSKMREFPLTPSHSVLDELYEPLSAQQLLRDIEKDDNNGQD